MKTKNLLKSCITVLLVSMLSFACASSSEDQLASGGIGGLGVSQGPITEFGSIFVNGVKFETDGAIVTIDDRPGNDSELKLGMFVTVKGSINDDGTAGTALSIEFEADIEGPIDSIDLAGNSLVVMSQTVIVDVLTKYENVLGLSDLNPNDMVEVSGLLSGSGVIQATLIERKPETFQVNVTEIELKGRIEGLDPFAETFLIGTQLVTYTGAVFEDMNPGDLTNGLLVEAKGTRDSSGLLSATKIEKEDSGLGESEEGLKVEVEGLVTDFSSLSEFSVNGQAVITTSFTQFKGGTADDIHLNSRVEVEGLINGSGVLVAKEIEFHQNKFKIKADVESIDLSANTVTLLGQTLVFNNLTEIEDKSSAEVENLSLANIQSGDRLEIKGTVSEGTLIATEVKRKDFDLIVEIEGTVDSFTSPSLSVLGLTVDTDINTDFEREEDIVLSQEAFFNLLTSETIVKATGTFDTGALAAEKVEIKD